MLSSPFFPHCPSPCYHPLTDATTNSIMLLCNRVGAFASPPASPSPLCRCRPYFTTGFDLAASLSPLPRDLGLGSPSRCIHPALLLPPSPSACHHLQHATIIHRPVAISIPLLCRHHRHGRVAAAPKFPPLGASLMAPRWLIRPCLDVVKETKHDRLSRAAVSRVCLERLSRAPISNASQACWSVVRRCATLFLGGVSSVFSSISA